MDCLDAIECYMTEVKSNYRSKKTVNSYFNNLINSFTFFGFKPIEEYTSGDIRTWKFVNMSRLNNRSMNGRLYFLRNFFNFCISNEWITINPVKKRLIPKFYSHKPKYIKESEYFKLLLAAEQLSLRDQTLIEFLDSAGVRRFEASMLNVGDLDIEKRTAQIRGKGNIAYVAKFSPTCAYHLKTLIPDGASSERPVFLNRYGKRLGTQSIYRICIDLGKQVGTEENIHPHRFRHTKATRIVRQGKSILEAKRALGHRYLDSTQIYAHIEHSLTKNAYFKAKEVEL